VNRIASISWHFACLAFLCLVAAGAAASEDIQSAVSDSSAHARAVKVYPDGSFDWDYLKNEVPYVNYVRDRMEADLYLLITEQTTGSGGYEYTIAIMGQGQFTGMNDTLTSCSKPTDSYEMKRAGAMRTLKMAFMRYVARTPIGEKISISYLGRAKPRDVIDPWDSWVFKLTFSPGVLGSQVYKLTNLSGSLSVKRVTPELNISFYGYSSYSETEQQLVTKTLKTIKRYGSFSGLVVKSLGDHWGAGGIVSGLQESYNNKKHYYEIAPAVEYSIFPYAEATRRSIAVFADIVFTDVTYHEMTIYNKTSEKLWSYGISLPGDIQEPWGSLYASIEWKQYLHDASVYTLSVYSSISFQLTKGLWLSIGGSYGRLHDQLDQPRRTLTDEEILLNLKELSSTYSYSFSIGFSYTFGSIYSNVVNPRFLGD
jgi:hypothetical protein